MASPPDPADAALIYSGEMADDDSVTRRRTGRSTGTGPTLVVTEARTVPVIASPSQETFIPTHATGTPNPRRTEPDVRPHEEPEPVNHARAEGYTFGELIGKGGMGEVVAAQDERIGRGVAIKRMRSANPDAEQLTRFLREAKIQARLDHPAIVPVHELGTDEAGRPYFTMKRISGRTLADHMKEGASPQKLLRALIDVCLAIELAHSKSVVHRDLKPANIMLGDFGEVYVLDWGVARVLTEGTEQRKPVDDIDTLDDGTQTGAMLGTPGYMAPEMIKGEPALQPADVYALGAILFEVLSGQALHPRGTAALASTLQQPQVAPRRRTDKAIAPELDAICFAALSEEPLDRPSARAVAEKMQAYLDGDRDLERRRALAVEQLERARKSLAEGTAAGRSAAIQRAGRALALDPEWTEAADLVTALVTTPPETLPPELEASLEREERKLTTQRSRAAFTALVSLFAFWAVWPLLGVEHWSWLIGTYVALALHAFYVYRGIKTGKVNIWVGLASALVFCVLASRVAGLFVVTPVLMCGTLLGFTSSSLFTKHRWLAPVWATAAFLIPCALEWTGVMPTSWWIGLHEIGSRSSIFAWDGPTAAAAMVIGNIVLVTAVGFVGIKIQAAGRTAKRALAIQNWHMNQLVPAQRKPWATNPSDGA